MTRLHIGAEMRAYLGGLLFIASLGVGAYLLTDGNFEQRKGLQHAINVSGRQRMLSQRIARFTHALIDAPGPAARARATEDLKAAADLFEASHLGLARGDPERGLPPPPPAARRIYFEGEPPLDEACAALVRDVREVLASARPAITDLEVVRIMDRTRGPLLSRLDDAVGAFEDAALSRMAQMRRTRRGLLAMMLLAFVAQVFIIFRPLVSQLRAQQRAIEEDRDWVEGLLEGISDVLLVCDERGVVVRCNQAAEVAWGAPRRKLVARPVRELVDPDAVADLAHADTNARHTTARRADGSTFPFEYRVAQLGCPTQVQRVITGRDATQQLERDQRLRVNELAFQSASEPMAVCTTGRDGVPDKVISVNAALLEATGLTWGEVLGRSFSELLAEDVEEETAASVAEAFEGSGALSADVPLRCEGGADFWADLSVVPVQRAEGRPTEVVCVFRDITERRAREQEAWAKANLDPVTGLPNRWSFERSLEDVLEQLGSSGGAAGLLFVDLDGFKAVNDTLGHDAGDALLCEIGRRLQGAVRGGDLVARLGGDEFVVVCGAVRGVEEVELVGARVLEAVCAPVDLDGQPARVGASIGVAVYPAHADVSSDLVRAADQAMYRAKAAGKGRVVVAEVSAQSPAA